MRYTWALKLRSKHTWIVCAKNAFVNSYNHRAGHSGSPCHEPDYQYPGAPPDVFALPAPISSALTHSGFSSAHTAINQWFQHLRSRAGSPPETELHAIQALHGTRKLPGCCIFS